MVSGGSHWPGRRNRRHNLPDGTVGWLQPARAAVLFGEHNLKAPQATRWRVARVSTPSRGQGVGHGHQQACGYWREHRGARRLVAAPMLVDDVSQTGASITVVGSVERLDLGEFLLVLSTTGPIRRRCQMAWTKGDVIGVRFIQPRRRRRGFGLGNLPPSADPRLADFRLREIRCPHPTRLRLRLDRAGDVGARRA